MRQNSLQIVIFCLVSLTASAQTDLLELSSKKKAALLGWQHGQSGGICPGYYVDPKPLDPADAVPGVAFSSDEAEIFEAEGKAYLNGHVQVRQGPYLVESEAARLLRDPASKQLYHISMQDYVRFWLPGFHVYSNTANYNLHTQSADLYGVLYRFKQPWQGAYVDSVGSAKSIKKRGEGQLTLKDATYSTCPISKAPWHVKASRLFVNQETGWASVTHARLYLGRIPVFYFPYYQFPINDQRKSGILMPSFGYHSQHDIDVTLPIYFNLAPNYDATYFPTYRQTQGWIHGLELRGLGTHMQSSLRYDVIHDDRLFARFKEKAATEYQTVSYFDRYQKAINQANQWRSAIEWEGSGNLGRFWSYDWHLEHVSDPYVYRDISQDEAKKTSDQLENKLNFSYAQNHWHGQLLVQQFQTLHRVDEDEVKDQYRQLPMMSLGYEASQQPVDVKWLAEWTNFDRGLDYLSQAQKATGQRSYGELDLAKRMYHGHYELTPEVLYRGIGYHHLEHEGYTDESLYEGFVSLITNQALSFERENHKKTWRQTLQPRLYTLWTPYKKQQHLPNFDTAWDVLSYEKLFSPYRFKGHDRVSDENRVALGLESKVLAADSGQELAAFRLGSGRSFRDRKVCLEQPCDDDTHEARLSVVAANASISVSEHRQLKADFAWLPEDNRVDNASFTWHYDHGSEKQFDLSYVYRRDSVSNEKAKHVIDSGLVWPLNPNWQGLVGYGYDLRKQASPKSYLGLKYESCCWAARLIGTREFRTDHEQNGADYDYGFKFQIMLKGLGTMGSSGADRLVNDFNPDYKDSFSTTSLGN